MTDSSEELAFDRGEEILSKFTEITSALKEDIVRGNLPLPLDEVYSSGLVLLSYWYEDKEEMTEEEILESYRKLSNVIYHTIKNKERLSIEN